MSDYRLPPAFEGGNVFLADWALSRVLLKNDARFAWLLLIPRRDGVTEVTDLKPQDRAILIEEIARASLGLQHFTGAAKMNVGALGNIVATLHVHVIARNPGDDAWPGPVWGHGETVKYEMAVLDSLLARLREAL